jgi:leucyl-tRNA synthetase
LFSRQRYWGEPFPVLHDEEDNIIPVKEEELPVTLPEMEDFRPRPSEKDTKDPQPPLSRAPEEWKTVMVNGKRYRREYNTMPQWAGSCWYYLRFIDPRNDQMLIDPEKEKYWMPVDLYVGGAEHSVLHLLYARFWHKVLYDIGVVSTKEPFSRLVHQGMILGQLEYTLYRDQKGNPVSADHVATDGTHRTTNEKLQAIPVNEDQVTKEVDQFVWNENTSIRIDARAYKMSKSRGNVVNPDDIIKAYGADSLRLYEMFMGPLKDMKSWSMRGVEGVHRFLSRVWRLVFDEDTNQIVAEISDTEPTKEHLKQLHTVIKKVTQDIENMQFNTAIAAMMVFVNEANKWEIRPRSILRTFMLILSPFAPHLAEEIWTSLGGSGSVIHHTWPSYDEEYLREEMKEIVIQMNGKLRGSMQIESDRINDRPYLEEKALEQEKIKARLEDKQVRKIIVVPGKLVNIVVS